MRARNHRPADTCARACAHSWRRRHAPDLRGEREGAGRERAQRSRECKWEFCVEKQVCVCKCERSKNMLMRRKWIQVIRGEGNGKYPTWLRFRTNALKRESLHVATRERDPNHRRLVRGSVWMIALAAIARRAQRGRCETDADAQYINDVRWSTK
jgi:hypothetical protein